MNIIRFLETVEAKPTGCPLRNVRRMLSEAELRPTKQRVALGWLLFAKGDRHVTPEMLHDEAQRAKLPVSLATIYNTLHQFTSAGILREIALDGSRTYFDTNVSEHHHAVMDNEIMIDIPPVELKNLPKIPEGYEIARVDVVLRLKKL
jgi:Fur family transcriptional regulator, iron response regulator